MKLSLILALTVGVASIAFTTQMVNASSVDPVTAQSADSGTMKRADGDMKRVLEQLGSMGGKPIETLTAAEARKQPTPADAVAALLKKDGKSVEEMNAKLGVTVKDLTYKAGKGEQKARVYMPEKKDDKPLPVIVYYHGGGFVIADIDVYDAAPRNMAKLANAIVVSAEYRHAPEAKFPAQHQDAFAAYKWVLENAASWGGDPATIAVMGESAGGNLATNVAIAARDAGIQKPVYMALIYPVAGNDMTNESYQENVNAKPLNKAMMEWFVKNTVSKDEDKNDPRINLVAADLKSLPNATVITAEIDPLRSEGALLATKLKDAGSKVDYKNYEGVTHEFFGMGAVVSDAKNAMDKVAGDLKNAFKKAEKSEAKK
jgi:acetyl esterase/lipase